MGPKVERYVYQIIGGRWRAQAIRRIKYSRYCNPAVPLLSRSSPGPDSAIPLQDSGQKHSATKSNMLQPNPTSGHAELFTPPPVSLNFPVHVKYWLRCLKTLLPNAYTEQDATRIPLAFFTLSALDLLNSLETHTTLEERSEWINFLYSCQHPGGGFRAFTGSKLGENATTAGNSRWDPANVAGTYFAIVSLVLLGDDLKRVQRDKTLQWIRRLQHPDGSFGELLAGTGTVEGSQDVRFCFLAALVCHVLGDEHGIAHSIDQEALAEFVLASKVCSATE